MTPLPGAIRLLDDLRAADMPVALVSASPRQIVDTVLRTIGAERFALVVAAEDTVRAKPPPDPYLKAVANLGVAPAECVGRGGQSHRPRRRARGRVPGGRGAPAA